MKLTSITDKNHKKTPFTQDIFDARLEAEHEDLKAIIDQYNACAREEIERGKMDEDGTFRFNEMSKKLSNLVYDINKKFQKKATKLDLEYKAKTYHICFNLNGVVFLKGFYFSDKKNKF